MFEVSFQDIAVGNRVSGHYVEGVVVAVFSDHIKVQWATENTVQNYTEAQFAEHGFVAYVSF